MKFKKIIIFLVFLYVVGCTQQDKKRLVNLDLSNEKKYRNSGFALVYNDALNIKKNLDDRSLQIFHKNLKKKSFVKITNPNNDKSLIAEVKSNKVVFSNFYNSIITNRIADTLELDKKEPYVEIVLISKNSTFVAQKSKIFDEEKNVAEKAPIDGINIISLNNNKDKDIKKIKKEKFSYSIKVADFYYKKSAKLMIDRIKDKTSLTKIRIIELSKTEYRVLLGPFNDINSLRESFEKMDSLFFENLEILKNV